MIGNMSAATVQARITALAAEREGLVVQQRLAQTDADALAFDAETDSQTKAERARHLGDVANAQRRITEIDAALAGAHKRLATIAAQEERARKTAATREAARLSEARLRAARRFDRLLAETERAFEEYIGLEPELRAQLRVGDLADPVALRVLNTRAARGVRSALWAAAPTLARVLGGPRVTATHARALAETERAIVPTLETTDIEPAGASA